MEKIKRILFAALCFCFLLGSIESYLPNASAASTTTASEHCIDFIKKVEGFSSQPYYDYNQYTVGYGTKCPTEKYFDYKANGIPKSEAEALLREAVKDIEIAISKKLLQKYNLTLTQYQFDALVSFSFNVGTGWITYDSTLRNTILRNANSNDIVYAFGLYCTAGGNYLPGLITRRLCEANMYLNGIYSKNVNNDYGYVYYDANGGTLTYRVQGYICTESSEPIADVVRTGDQFIGWFTDLTGGTQVTVLNSAINGKTLFARWQSSETTEEDIDNTTVRVTGDVVNVRKGPGTNYGVVKQVYRNTILTVSHITQLTSMRWGKVQDGWISLDYTNYDAAVNGTDRSETLNEEKTDADEVTVPDNDPDLDVEETKKDTPAESRNSIWGTVHVNDLLRIRSGPGTNYPVVGFLFNNKEVEIFEMEITESMDWGRTTRGWVSMDYIVTDEPYVEDTINPDTNQIPTLTPDQEAEDSFESPDTTEITGQIKADVLRVRAGAGTNNPIVGFYYENDIVTVYEKKLVDAVYWGKTSRGWINMDYLVTNAVQEEPVPPIEGKIMTVIGDCLRVRKGTGTNFKIAALLYYGDRISVLETTEVDGVLWGRVHNGWICMDYVA